MDLKIDGNDEFLKKLKQKENAGVPTVQVNPNGNNAQGAQGADGQSFESKYGSDNVFGAANNIASGSATPTYQNTGAAAGSTQAPINTNDNGGNQTFSLADAVQMDNLPVAVTATSVQSPELPSALTATGNSERNGQQGGATGDGSGADGKTRFGAENLFETTGGGLGKTEKTPDAGEGGYASVFGSTPPTIAGTGDTGGLTGGNGINNDGGVNGDGGVNNDGGVNGDSGVNGNNGNTGNVNDSGNADNPNDSANGDVDNKDSANPKAENDPKAEDKRSEEKRTEAEEKKAQEKLAEEAEKQAA